LFEKETLNLEASRHIGKNSGLDATPKPEKPKVYSIIPELVIRPAVQRCNPYYPDFIRPNSSEEAISAANSEKRKLDFLSLVQNNQWPLCSDSRYTPKWVRNKTMLSQMHENSLYLSK
jgi:hypothetical protein